jgi:cytochrome c2
MLEEGANYGWPLETYGTDYTRAPIPNARSIGFHEEFTKPAYAWLPSIATSSLMRVDGFLPAWDGDFIVGSLGSGRQLVRIRTDGKRVVFAEQIDVGRPIRDLIQLDESTIVLWTDWYELIFLKVNGSTDGFADGKGPLDLAIGASNLSKETAMAVRSAMDNCAVCHAFEPGGRGTGPSLARVYGSQIGSVKGFQYSKSLSQASGKWTDQRLHAFIKNPSVEIPGTSMADPGVTNEETIDGIVRTLAKLKGSRQ